MKWLHEHDEVTRVHYPLHPSDPGFAVASEQMSGFGGMVSFVLRGDLKRAETFCASTRIFHPGRIARWRREPH